MDRLTPARHRLGTRAQVTAPAAERSRRIILAGLLATIAMVVLHAATQAINYGAFDLRIWALNADKRYSVFGVASLLAQMGFAAGSAWRASRVEQRRWPWFVLGALVGGLVFVRGLTSFNATVLAAPLACVFWLLCWVTWPDLRTARKVVWVALILLMTSLLLHKVGLAADSSTGSDYTWAYQITGIVKHGAELAGWMLLATGIIAGGKPRQAPEVTPPGSLALSTQRLISRGM